MIDWTKGAAFGRQTMSEEKFCPTCEDYRLFRTEERSEPYTVRGIKIDMASTVEVCAHCGSTLFDEVRDEALLQKAFAEYRAREKLLTPDEIKDIRSRWRLSQKSWAALLGMSESTINRYENGGLQDRAHDTAMRACRNPEFVMEILDRHQNLLSDAQRRAARAALTDQPIAPRRVRSRAK